MSVIKLFKSGCIAISISTILSCSSGPDDAYRNNFVIDGIKYEVLNNSELQSSIPDHVIEHSIGNKFSYKEIYYKDGTYINTTEGTHRGRFYIDGNLLCMKLYVLQCVYILRYKNKYYKIIEKKGKEIHTPIPIMLYNL